MELDSFTRGHFERWLEQEIPERHQDETRQRILRFVRENDWVMDAGMSWCDIDLRTKE